ncbi:MAG: aldehyde ferredoxin oxidoreductase family protein [Zestosphaera sp.]
MVFGFNGKLLDVDLSKGEVRVTELREDWFRLYVGGSGYATRHLYDLIDEETEPLSPDNVLVVMTGPFVDTFPISPKTAFVTKSPLTGYLGKSMVGGSFGAMLKRAGFDGIIFRGASEKPVYLAVIEDQAEIKDASRLWGKDVLETSKIIKNELNSQKIKIAAIGPAGENLVRIAAVITDERRAAGRTGVGAVMGSKKLKAIAVYGSKKVQVYDREKLVHLMREHLAAPLKSPRGVGLRSYGTSGGLIGYTLDGNVPIKNWTKGIFDKVDNITGQTLQKVYKSRGVACGTEIACSIQCHKELQVSEVSGDEWEKCPEFETLALMGTNLMIGDGKTLIAINKLCDRLGLDTISTGGVIAWAMEAYEKGYLKAEDLGFELKWGDGEAVLKLIEMIAYRKGLGDLLAEGVKRASRKISPETEEFAIHVKGLELPAHHPRRYHSIGLAYATSNIGASHLQGMTMLVERGILLPEYGISEVPKDIESKVKVTVIHQSLCAFLDSAGLCKFGVFGIIDFNKIAEEYTAITGFKTTKEDILETGERIWYLERLLNLKLGLRVEEDTIPKRFVKEPLDEGPIKGVTCPIDQLLELFYRYRDLDLQSGYPSKDKIDKLGLDVAFS